jgi:predicted Zn-dependent protease
MLRFPTGWELSNGAEQVTARAGENSSVAMVLEPVTVSGPVAQAARSQMTTAGFRLVDGQMTQINGLQAYVGEYEGAMSNSVIRVRAAHIRHGSATYLVAGVAPTAEFARADAAFLNTIRSFRPLTAAEAERIQPSRASSPNGPQRLVDMRESPAHRRRSEREGVDARHHERRHISHTAPRAPDSRRGRG